MYCTYGDLLIIMFIYFRLNSIGSSSSSLCLEPISECVLIVLCGNSFQSMQTFNTLKKEKLVQQL